MLVAKDLIARSNPELLVVAHRGAWDRAPENSIAAIEDAIAVGAHIVEIDAQYCRSGEFVVFHDWTLDRMTAGSGRVSDARLDELAQLRLRATDGRHPDVYSDHGIPTLAEALECARGRIVVNIDAKRPSDLPAIVDLVEALGVQQEVIIKSDYDPAIGELDTPIKPLLDRVTHIPMMRVRSGQFLEDLAAMRRFQPAMIELMFDDLGDVAGARELLDHMQIRLWVNTLDPVHSLDFCDRRADGDPDSVWGILEAAGVGAFQTDIPRRLTSWIRERQASGS